MDWKSLYRRALSGQAPDDADLAHLTALAPDEIAPLAQAAHWSRQEVFGDAVGLCAIVNAKSGACPEDCAFCAQAARNATGAAVHPFIGPKRTLDAAESAEDAGATRFGVVLSGAAPSDEEFEALVETVAFMARRGPAPDLSAGLLDESRLVRLKDAGLSGLHHNLETSRDFFPSICTTHDYEEDVATVRAAVRTGLYVCSGGLFGLGESWPDRIALARTLAELGVDSVPINFLHPIPGTPLADRPILEASEAVKIIALFRLLLPKRALRLCGGRSSVFRTENERNLALCCGANGIMIGDYLTVSGGPIALDLTRIRSLGLRPEAR